jgi:hypothetical protein
VIDLRITSPTFARFVRDLDAQAAGSSTLAPDLAGASAEDLGAARRGWSSRIADEQRSVIVFSQLLAHLAVLGMPYETLATVQRLIADELRHARLCAELAIAFGGIDLGEVGPFDRELPPAITAGESIAARAIAIVARELVVAEGESVAVLPAYRAAATDPACRAALAAILRDEARHFAAGKHLLERLIPAMPIRELEPLIASLPATMRADAAQIRAEHRAAASTGPARFLAPGRRYGVSIAIDEAPPTFPIACAA